MEMLPEIRSKSQNASICFSILLSPRRMKDLKQWFSAAFHTIAQFPKLKVL